MMYTLTEDLITADKPVAPICLADWGNLDGFDWSNLDAAEDLILPAVAQAKAAGALRTIAVDRPGDSPNWGGFGAMVPSPCREAVTHWWGNPVGQSHDGVVAWLRNPRSYASAHFVLSPGRVTQILPLTAPSWANSNTWANTNAVTFELNPNYPEQTIITYVQLLVQLQREGKIAPDYRMTGHRDWGSTACPGIYYPRLAAIRNAARTTITGAPAPDTEEDIVASIEELMAYQVAEVGGGKVTLGEMIAEYRQQHRDTIRVAKATVDALLDAPITRGGKAAEIGPQTSLRAILGWSDSAVLSVIDAASGGDRARLDATIRNIAAQTQEADK